MLLLWTCLFAQDNKEILFQIDTMQISPNMRTMVFKYYENSDRSPYRSDSGNCRYEISYLDESIPFQKDTIEIDRDLIEYEDANFDNILDMKINTCEWANSGETDAYYFFNPKSNKYEYGVGDLSNPTINKQDSTMSTEAHCCNGTIGNGKTYKFVNGKFKLIRESGFSQECQYDRELIGNILITTDSIHITTIVIHDGRRMSVDSTWKYLFGRLRIVFVSRDLSSETSDEGNQKNGRAISENEMGAVPFEYEETFEYSKETNGIIICSYVLNKIKNKELELVKQSKWQIEQ